DGRAKRILCGVSGVPGRLRLALPQETPILARRTTRASRMVGRCEERDGLRVRQFRIDPGSAPRPRKCKTPGPHSGRIPRALQLVLQAGRATVRYRQDRAFDIENEPGCPC